MVMDMAMVLAVDMAMALGKGGNMSWFQRQEVFLDCYLEKGHSLRDILFRDVLEDVSVDLVLREFEIKSEAIISKENIKNSNEDGDGDENGFGFGDGHGYSHGQGIGEGYGSGYGHGYGAGDGSGSSIGSGSGYGHGRGRGHGFGFGFG
jgi:hypothetical protein